MDLELSDEQRWLSEAVETLLARETEHGRLWASLVDFGALSVGGDDGLGAVELCLIARALGAHLAPVPYLGSAAVRFAAAPLAAELDAEAVALAVLEPGSSWGAAPDRTGLEPVAGGHVVTGRKTAVEHAGAVARLAVVAAGAAGPGAGRRRRRRARRRPRPAARVRPDGADVRGRARRRPGRLRSRSAARRSRGWRPSARCWRPPRRSERRGACSTTRAATPPSGASSAARSAASRRCATCWPTCTCARPARGRRSSTRRRRSTRTPTRRAADGVDRQGVRVARGPRGRARRDAGVRRHRRDGGASGPPVPAPDHRARAAVRRCGRTTSARSGAALAPRAVPEPVS